MLILLFLFWMLLGGQWTGEAALVGAVLSCALYAFMAAFLGYSPKREWAVIKRLPRIIAYAGFLLAEIVKSAWAVLKMIWTPGLEPEPQLISVPTKLRTRAGKVLLSDSITLTPGTITVSIQDDRLLVHCLDRDFAIDENSFPMEDKILGIEGGKGDAGSV